MLKLKFQRLHTTVITSVNPASVINFLFQEGVVGNDDMRALLKFKDDPQHQCTELLALLHTSENPQAFVQLYAAIKEESHLQWLIDRIDKFTDQSLIDLLRQRHVTDQSLIDLLHQMYISEPTGQFAFLKNDKNA